MKKKMLELLTEYNTRLAADAAFCKLGDEAFKLITNPAKAQLPKELQPLLDSPFARLLAALGVSFIEDKYNVPGLDTVGRAVSASAMKSVVDCLGDMVGKLVVREDEVLAKAKDVTPAAAPAANTAKGGKNVVTSGFLAVENKVKEILGQPKQNVAEGNENIIDAEVLTEQDADDVPYWPTTAAELTKNDKGLCLCPNPIEGKEAHFRQRDKFQPWKAKNYGEAGYCNDLDGLMICGGCRVDLETAYGKEKKALQQQAEEAKALAGAQEKIDTMTKDYDELCEKLAKAEKYRITLVGILTDDPTNEDCTKNLADQEKKVQSITTEKERIEAEVQKLEELLDSKANGNKAEATKPVVTNVSKGAEVKVIQPQANAKPSSGAAALIKGKKNRRGK